MFKALKAVIQQIYRDIDNAVLPAVWFWIGLDLKASDHKNIAFLLFLCAVAQIQRTMKAQ